jgi:hypothetical protein
MLKLGMRVIYGQKTRVAVIVMLNLNTSNSAAVHQVSNLMGKDGTTEWSRVVR